MELLCTELKKVTKIVPLSLLTFCNSSFISRERLNLKETFIYLDCKICQHDQLQYYGIFSQSADEQKFSLNLRHLMKISYKWFCIQFASF